MIQRMQGSKRNETIHEPITQFLFYGYTHTHTPACIRIAYSIRRVLLLLRFTIDIKYLYNNPAIHI